jgi:hypothetical protein
MTEPSIELIENPVTGHIDVIIPPEIRKSPRKMSVYVLCFGEPRLIRDRDYLSYDRPHVNYPISHYVGFTGRYPPLIRIKEHGAWCANYIAAIIPGANTADEYLIKRYDKCPKCNGSLWYYAESLTYDFPPLPTYWQEPLWDLEPTWSRLATRTLPGIRRTTCC